MMFSRVFLVSTAAVFLGFGVWGATMPDQMLARFGVTLNDPAGKTAVRAMYGGFLIGAALLFGFCAASPGRVSAGLQAVLILSLGIFTTRLLGMLIDRSATPYHLSYAALELLGISVSALLLLRRANPAGF
jgi:hypothetical protein